MSFKKPQGVGTGHHKRCYFVSKGFFKGVRVNHTVFGSYIDNFIACHHSRSGVCAVGRVRYNNFCFFIALIFVVGSNQHNPRKFTIGA